MAAFHKLGNILFRELKHIGLMAVCLSVDGSLLVQRHVCVLMVDDSWRMLLNAFQAVINHGCGEYLVLELLKGYQSILHACAALHIIPALNAFLGSLCDLSLPSSMLLESAQQSGEGQQTPDFHSSCG